MGRNSTCQVHEGEAGRLRLAKAALERVRILEWVSAGWPGRLGRHQVEGDDRVGPAALHTHPH